jgi:hypothetical protein
MNTHTTETNEECNENQREGLSIYFQLAFPLWELGFLRKI